MFNYDFKRLLSISNIVHHSGGINISQIQRKINRITFACELRVDNKKFEGPKRRSCTVNGLCEDIVLPEGIMNAGKEREISGEGPSRKRLTFDENDADHVDIVHTLPEEETGSENSAN
ncbi:unnamed protein product [Cuscuta campestris]|uniref:Uncharacterized protein n=1 Tax=Cuscuta campestris TaxID=132261 RepID=A0A484MA10_9ASTE|nr:unnamed protein product [Cuscuta campestris]